jgi:hypothetical protein
MSDQAQLSEISEFFSDYTKLFDERNGANIAKHNHAGRRVCSRLSDSPGVAGLFSKLSEKYYAEGLRRSTFTNLEVKAIGSKSVLASLDWQMRREDESIIRAWRQSYNLVRLDGRWQILALTIHI